MRTLYLQCDRHFRIRQLWITVRTLRKTVFLTTFQLHLHQYKYATFLSSNIVEFVGRNM